MGWSRIFVMNQVMFVTRSTTHLEFGLCWRTHSRKSMLLISWTARSKSSGVAIRNGCSNTRLLLAEGWWYWRAPVSVFRKMNPKAKFTLKTVVWSAKMRLSYSRRREGLMVDRRKFYQSCNRLRRLKRVRIWDQCWRYVWVISSLLGMRFEGIRTGSACQFELTAASSPLAAGACSGVVLGVFLAFLEGGASTVFVAVRLQVVGVEACWEGWCAVWIWTLYGARLWKVSPQVLQVKVR